MEHRLLRASAGTGKTYQLVEAYVSQILEHGLKPSEIVAITFTRKAAMELKLRIRKKLQTAGVSHAVLTDLARAPISNFHGLALQLLRTFAFAGGLAEGSRILGDAGDDMLLFMDACEGAWFEGDPDCAAAIEAVATRMSVDVDLPAALWTAVGRAREDGHGIDAALWGSYDTQARQGEAHTQLTQLRDTLLRDGAEATGKSQEKLAAFAGSAVPKAHMSAEVWSGAWRNAFGNLDRRGNLGKIYSKEQQVAWQAALTDVAAEYHCVALLPALDTLLTHAWRTYEAAKDALRAVDFADIIIRLVDLLENNEDLHATLRRRFRAVLVDEAQDTNRLQRRMVHLLAGITGPAATSTQCANLFVVGDWKQSIYTFRGADPASFALFAADLRDRGGAETTLSVSRRSAPPLVHSINHLGAALFAQTYEGLEPLDTASAHAAAAAGMAWCALPADDSPEALTGGEPEAVARVVRAQVDAGASAGDFAILLATMTQAPAFARALAAVGIPAVLGGGGGLYQQPEVIDTVALCAWLCERRDRLSAAVALRSPLVGLSDEGLLALCGEVAGQGDGIEALHRGTWPLPGRVFGPADSSILATFAELMPTLVGAASQQSAATLLVALDEALDARAIYLGQEGGEQRHANLNRLLAMAERFDESQRGSASRFVRQQQERIERGHAEPMSAVASAARRAVTISSVHQSKGLQYPVVILSNLARRSRQDIAPVRYGRDQGLVFRPRVAGESHKSWRWRQVQEQDADVQDGEIRRLLYVAVTRAEKKVIFVGPAPAALGSAGFGGILGPWAVQAQAEGLLQELPLPPAPTAPVLLPSSGEAPPPDVDTLLRESLDVRLPAGTHFDLSVTQLAAQAAAPAPRRASSLVQDLRAGLTFDPEGERDPPLDPLSRGRLAHAILAAMPRRPQHRTDAAFIASELNLQGFAADDTRLDDVREDVAYFLGTALGEQLLQLPAKARRHEMPFTMPLEAAPYAATLHGQIDLLAWDQEGPLLVDYKHAHQGKDLGPYLLQLNAYAAAVAQLCNFEGPIRSYLVFLRDRSAPYAHKVTPDMRASVATQAAALVQSLASPAGRLS